MSIGENRIAQQGSKAFVHRADCGDVIATVRAVTHRRSNSSCSSSRNKTTATSRIEIVSYGSLSNSNVSMTSTSSLRHRHAKDEHSEPLLASNASTLDREVEDPLLLPPPSPLEHHRRCHTVTNIAEVYKQVGNTLMAAAERDAASFQEDATVHDNINAVTAGAIANLCSATLGAGK